MPKRNVEPAANACRVCGKEFLVGGRGRPKRTAIYCSQACAGRARSADAEARLKSRIIVNTLTGCWEFQGSRNPEGYGNVKYRGRNEKAHRLAAHFWLDFDLTSPLSILHHCDNPPCINPAHLYPGSKAQNSADMVRRGRQYVPGIRGTEHWRARFTEDDIREIRNRCAAGETQKSVAESFGVYPADISKIVNRKRWGHVI